MMTKAKPMTPKSQASTPKGNLKGVKNTPIGKNKTPKFKATPTGKVSLINGTPKSTGKQNAGNNTPKGKQNSPAFTPKNKQGNGKAFTPSNKQNTPQGKKNSPKGQKSPKTPGQKSPLTEEQLKLKAAQIVGKVDDEDESDDSDEDINEGVEIDEEVSEEEADSDAEEESGDDGITGILGNSLADDSDDDDEDFDDDDEDDEEVENKGIKKFKGLKPSLAGEDDDEEDEDSSGDDDEDSLNNSGPGLKALLGQSLAEDDDDEDFTDNDEEEEEDDDISDDEEDELESSPVKVQKNAAEDEDDDEDEDEEDDDSEEAEDDTETSKLSILEDDSDEDDEENASDEDLDTSKDDSADHDNLLTPEERAEREKRSIYVGNLPKDVQKSKVLGLFKQFGPVETVRIRGAVGKDAKTSKKVAAIKRDELHPDVPALHAYVRFAKEASAKKALALNGHKMDDFYLRVDLAGGDGPKPDTKKAVFLGNLSFKLDDNSVWAHFADCGKVTSVRIVRDRKTGMGKGFGYVNFETTDAVALALKLNGTSLMEREIRVQRCSDKPQKKQRTGGQKRPHPESNKGGSPKKLKDGSGDAVSVATHNSQNAERRKEKRSQGAQQRQTGNGKPGFKQGGGGFQGQKADNNKKQKFNKFDKKKKQVAAKFAAKPRKPTAD